MDEALARAPVSSLSSTGVAWRANTRLGNRPAENESQAREMVPSVVRNKARIVQVDKVTPDHINAMLYMPPEPEGPADTPDPYEVVLASMEEDETDEDMWARTGTWVTP
jgi:hypothetical protein